MTTSSLAGLVALDALLLVAGLGLLVGIGLVRTPREALRHGGLGLVVGWAAVGIVESWALVVGAPITRWVVVSISAALVAAGVLASQHIPARRLRVVGEPGRFRWIAAAGAAVAAVQLGALLWRVATQGAPLQWDAWAFWLPKARSIFEFGGLDTGVGGFTSFASPGYPPLVPALDATVFSFVGSTDASPLAVQQWLIAVAFVAAVWSLLSVRVRPAILLPCLALLVSLPNVVAMIGSSLGDEALMLLLGLGSACAALWLLERDGSHAALAALFFCAAALAKNEGLPPALVMGATMLAVALARSPRRVTAPVLVLLAPLAAYAPWRMWMSAHGLPPSTDYRLSELFQPWALADRWHRLSYAAEVLPAHIFSRQQWLVAVPLMLLGALLATRRRPALSLLALASVGAVVIELLVVYWIGLRPVEWHVHSSVDRVIASAVVMAAVFLPVLLNEASSSDSPPREAAHQSGGVDASGRSSVDLRAMLARTYRATAVGFARWSK